MSAVYRLTWSGFALIAVTYGLARFAYGLFLPEMSQELGLGRVVSGFIGGGVFLGYCVAIVAAAVATERLGPRVVAVAAGGVATLGLLGISFAPNAGVLAACVLVAGLSTGLSSPPLAAAISTAVPGARRAAANTIVNAGAGAGIALSGPAAILIGAAWRDAYLGFAAVAALSTVASFLFTPSRPGAGPVGGAFDWRPFLRPEMRALVAASFLTGAASTAGWTFGADLLASASWGRQEVAAFWTVIGVAGLVGAWAGRLSERFGLDLVHRAMLAGLAAAIALVGAGMLHPPIAVIGGALFGIAYITLTGVYLLWGVEAMAERPASGLGVAFLMIAVGQTVGAPVFGALLQGGGPTVAMPAFAGLALLALPLRRGPKRLAPPVPGASASG
ncbi:MFS transporter [Lutibaculum baratangense]|uniref:Sugar efflux permease n=1 Tax=Lutibaculum baratangense AMV1 TaxID=631454 RepID=V4RS74_9HYPH|nr:MFS transporter [Lutibaculum baratangense]ESR25975.1 Sugar efflux permease [Lutibaculum baratangense AMV1]